MLKTEERMEIAVLRSTRTASGPSRERWRVSRNTVRRYLHGGEEAAIREPAPKRRRSSNPFEAYAVDRLKAAVPDLIPPSPREQGTRLHGPRDSGKAIRARPAPAPKPDPSR